MDKAIYYCVLYLPLPGAVFGIEIGKIETEA
jgi:hypothetical protein